MAVAFNCGPVGGAAKACVGPLSPLKAVAGQTRQPDITGNNRTSSEHIPGISGHFRAFPDTRGSSRVVSSVAGHGVPYGPSLRDGPSPDRVRSGSSRAVSPVAGSCAVSPVARSRVVMSRPVSATSCLCRVHGRASRTSVAYHVPAQQPPVADAATGGIRTCILLYGRGALSWRVRRRG